MKDYEKHIYTLLGKYCKDINHAQQVKFLSLMLFDETNSLLHDYSKRKRRLLKAGALLHDIGYYIEAQGHNKHSYELIMKEKFEYFEPEEVAVIANIARYHRGKLPEEKHENYSSLPDKKTCKLVDRLSAMVRIADGLDREHRSIIRDLKCSYDEDSRVLTITAYPKVKDYGFNYRVLTKKKDLFEKAFKVQLVFEVG